MALLALPEEILLVVLRYLSVRDIAALSSSNKLLYLLVEKHGWSDYNRLHTRPHMSLRQSIQAWDARTQLRYTALSDKSWSRGDISARRLSRPWVGKLQSVMAVSPSRLVVAAGDTVYSYLFSDTSPPMQAPSVHLECTFTLPYSQAPDVRRDISSVSFLPDGGLHQTLCIGFADGAIERATIPASHSSDRPFAVPQISRTLMDYVPGDLITSLSTSSDYVLSLSASGRANVQLAASSALDSALSTVNLDATKKAWVAHLSPRATYAAFGTSSSNPLSIHALTETGLTNTPTSILSGGKSRSPAVYGICSTPPGAPWGASEHIVVSGWFDGVVRIHDLRSRARMGMDAEGQPAPTGLSPVLSLWDPWSCEAVYSVAFGGGACAHAAAGSARHSLVAFWDVRFSATGSTHNSGANRSKGWSAYAPGSEHSSSPVYALHLESSRAFGTTQSAPFVLDFGPGVGVGTYDDVPPVDLHGAMRGRRTSVPARVTKYPHSTGSVDH